MTIEATTIKTDLGAEKLRVTIADSLTSGEAYKLARLPGQNGYLPYLLAGFFTNNLDFNKWFFSNARRHNELEKASRSKVSRGCQFYWGQLFFEPAKLTAGNLLISQISLQNPPSQKTAFSLLIGAIDQSILDKRYFLDFIG